MVSCDRVKIFGDGSLGAETAALRYDYVATADGGGGGSGEGARKGRVQLRHAQGEPNRGTLIHSRAELHRRVAAAIAGGYRLEVHARA
jgi:predicted amidohydrolase YtcJ